MAEIVAVTASAAGIAQALRAAEGLQRGADALGHPIRVETQESVGARTPLSSEEIARADVVIVAANRDVDTIRFTGKRLYQSTLEAAIEEGESVLRRALAEATVAGGATGVPGRGKRRTGGRAAKRGLPYRHLVTGVSYMLPFVVAGGLLIALGFVLGGINVFDAEGTFGWALHAMGRDAAFALMVPVLAGYIAFSIAERPGLAPGMVGGLLATTSGAGFLGGIIAGFLAGYLTAWLNRVIHLPRTLLSLKAVLILPLASTILVGTLMIFVIGTPVRAILAALTAWLGTMQNSSAVVLGLILGAMMALDMGGPVNKAAYTFALGLLDKEAYQPMAAVMAAGMTPPLGLALASTLFKNRFTADEQAAGKAAALLGIAFITEGAIPFAARDPLHVIPSIVAGSAVAGALSMLFGVALRVPHGGLFVLFIPHGVNHLPLYLLAILAGTLVTAAMLYWLKHPVAEGDDHDKPDGGKDE